MSFSLLFVSRQVGRGSAVLDAGLMCSSSCKSRRRIIVVDFIRACGRRGIVQLAKLRQQGGKQEGDRLSCDFRKMNTSLRSTATFSTSSCKGSTFRKQA